MIKANPPSIGLIGCGAIAEEFYLPYLAADAAIRDRLWLIDPTKSRTAELAEKFGIRNTAEDYRAVLPNLDSAIVAVPPQLHHPIVMECLDAGLHVLCEKPLALHSEHVHEMVEKADAVDRHLMVNLNRRFCGSLMSVRDAIQEGRYGKPLFIDYYIRETFSWPTVSGWYFDSKRNTKGVLLDRGAHVFDTIYWWLGAKPEITEVFTDSIGGPEAMIQVGFRHQQCEGRVTISLLAKAETGYTIKLEKGEIQGEEYDITGYQFTGTNGGQRRVNVTAGAKRMNDIGKLVTQNFMDVARGIADPIVAGREAIASSEFIDEAYGRAQVFPRPWYDEDPNLALLKQGARS